MFYLVILIWDRHVVGNMFFRTILNERRAEEQDVCLRVVVVVGLNVWAMSRWLTRCTDSLLWIFSFTEVHSWRLSYLCLWRTVATLRFLSMMCAGWMDGWVWNGVESLENQVDKPGPTCYTNSWFTMSHCSLGRWWQSGVIFTIDGLKFLGRLETRNIRNM